MYNIYEVLGLFVSIHALAWSATAKVLSSCSLSAVSIHALAWSATVDFDVDIKAQEFQSTRSHGARRPELIDRIAQRIVSIHALAWSATGNSLQSICRYIVSIHALAWSATPMPFAVSFGRILFQSTRSHGARLTQGTLLGFPSVFQSTRSHGARHRPNRLRSL